MPSEPLKNLMEQASENRLVLPDFQRDFVWKPSDVTKLLASLLNGYPIGGLLFMESPGIYGQRPLDGVTLTQGRTTSSDTRLVLDGQQRLTSCYRAFYNGLGLDNFPGRYYFNYGRFLESPGLLNSEVEELIFFYREKEVRASLSSTASEQAAALFPLDIILQQPRGTDYSKWLSDYTFSKAGGNKEEFDRLSQLQSDFIRRFIERITGYQVHYEEIKKGTSSDVICTVFEAINTTGKRLTVFDLLVARCYPHGMNLREMLQEALEDQLAIKLFDPDGEGIAPIALPRIIALKEKETARRGDILDLPPEAIKKHWNFAVDALEHTLDVMTQRYGCYGERFVPLVDMIAPMAIIMASDKFNRSTDNLRLLDKWYWRCVFSQYFISSVETKLQRTVRQWLGQEGWTHGWLDDKEKEPDSVRDFSFRSSIIDDVSRVDNAVYRGVISLILSHSVRDVGSERKNLASSAWEEIQDHHIYPKGLLAAHGIKGEKANNIANRTPLLRTTNAAIGNFAPNVYLTDPSIVGNQPVAPIIANHLIDRQIVLKPFSPDIYDQFVTSRKKEILEAIKKVVEADPITD
jgi:hypothetical protein